MATASKKRGIPQLTERQREAQRIACEHFGIDPAETPATLTTAEAERRFGRSRWAWLALARSGEIASVSNGNPDPRGRRYRLLTASVFEFLARQLEAEQAHRAAG
ncbi:MAG: hypothetical protein AAFO89_02370 [Planctomycetota bacterium]